MESGTSRCVFYKRGYKNQLTRDFSIQTALRPAQYVALKYITLSMGGLLTIKAGYAWDGASGPTWDTKNSIRGSLVHDALYQLIRLGYIEEAHKPYADQMLYDLCVEDGMFEFRASYWRWAVLTFGAGDTKPSAEPQEEVAP